MLDQGVLLEQGTHESLYASGGLYHTLVEKQRIAMKEPESEGKGDEDIKEEVTKFITTDHHPAAGASPGAHVTVTMGGMMALPDAHEMVAMANLRRKAEKKQVNENILF